MSRARAFRSSSPTAYRSNSCSRGPARHPLVPTLAPTIPSDAPSSLALTHSLQQLQQPVRVEVSPREVEAGEEGEAAEAREVTKVLLGEHKPGQWSLVRGGTSLLPASRSPAGGRLGIPGTAWSGRGIYMNGSTYGNIRVVKF